MGRCLKFMGMGGSAWTAQDTGRCLRFMGKVQAGLLGRHKTQADAQAAEAMQARVCTHEEDMNERGTQGVGHVFQSGILTTC